MGPQEIFSSPVLPLSLWSSPRKAFGEYGISIVKVEKESQGIIKATEL